MGSQCRTLVILGLTLYLTSIIIYSNKHLIFRASNFFNPLLISASFSQPFPTQNFPRRTADSPTNLSHIAFGLVGSEKAWGQRKAYTESWWRPNSTKGYIFLDIPPGSGLLPWPETSPPFKVSDDLRTFLSKPDLRAQRMVHGIMEALREVDDGNLRWLVMGDDDSIFFVENIVDVLAQYDHTKYYYLGGHSECILSNYLFSFNQAFGGAGIMLSYPLAKALARDMENCLKRYEVLNSADNTTRACIADIGANLTPQQGNHQIDLLRDISGFLSAHPLSPLLSLHHFDVVEPIFPKKDRFDSTRHLMMAAAADQSRMLQQTICHLRQSNWTFSISWGYSAQIYEGILPRSYLQIPIETFRPWARTYKLPHYLFNTRKPSADPCKAPHAFFFESVQKIAESGEIVTRYSRAWPRALPPCLAAGNNSAEFISMIEVFSPPTKRAEVDRCECCDVMGVENGKADIRFRKCRRGEIIA